MGLFSGLAKSIARRPPAAVPATKATARSEGAEAVPGDGGETLPARLLDARRRIESNPDDAEAWYALASTLKRWGRAQEALAAFRGAHDRDRRSVPIALGLGVASWDAGRRDEAISILRQAHDASPGAHDLALALASMLVSVGAVGEARVLAGQASESEATRAAALVQLARCDHVGGDDAAALENVRGAIAIDDSELSSWQLLATLESSRGGFDAALDALTRAQAIADSRGVDFDASFGKAEILRRRGDFAGAAQLLATALRRNPNASGHFMLAEALIVQGRYREGWRQYEFRRFDPSSRKVQARYGKPEWTGQDLEGRTLLVEAEQGIGDVVWFARYLPLLKRRGARIVFLPRIDMMDLSRRLHGVDHVLTEGEPLPPFDFHVKLMSLPARFGTTLDTVPGGVPYLAPDPAYASRWKARLVRDGRPRVGIVWAGKPAQPRDRFRSLRFEQILPILRVEGPAFFSLQKGQAESQLDPLPDGVEITALGKDFESLEDLVAAMAEMDLVISVCTGPAHIAGAMGKPVWTMISEPPDLRWLTGRDDSPWYPTMRLFRQRVPGEWAETIDRVASQLGRGPSAWHRLSIPDRVDVRMPDPAPKSLPRLAGDIDAGLAQLAETRYGLLMFDSDEADAGSSLARYGEWLHAELELALRLISSGAVVVEAGAGIGAHAVPIGRALAAHGRLMLYEDRLAHRRMLRQNLVANDAGNAETMSRLLGGPGGTDAEHDTVDDLQLDRLDLLKAGATADADAIIEGAQQTLWRCRPRLLLARRDDATLERLAARVREFGYRTWRSETPLHPPTNFNRREDDMFGGARALALVAVPEEVDFRDELPGCVELR